MDRGVWVLGEERNGTIHSVSYEMLAWGRDLADKLGEDLTCIILGESVLDQAQGLIYRGADKVLAVNHVDLAVFRVDPYARILATLIKKYHPEIFLASATTIGRTVMPVLAARIHTGLTADCTDLDIDVEERLLLQSRPAIGGNVLATIKTPKHRPQMATVRPKSKRPLPQDSSRQGKITEEQFDESFVASRVARLAFEPDTTSDAPIQNADIVVAGGKGLKNAKGFTQVFEIAGRLGGAVGASRVAVDQGWVSYAHQVGLSGKSVTPKLYMALGISGSPNHLAGMSSSEAIVAINKDPDANIFKLADFGIVGDLVEIMPILLERLDTPPPEEGAPNE
jgi:electron transfer flavoprotein alpha subunit